MNASERLVSITRRNLKEHIRKYRETGNPANHSKISRLLALMFRLRKPTHRVSDARTIGG